VDPLNPSFSSLEGVLFNKAKTELLRCPETKIGGYSILDGVTRVGNNAFSDCQGLVSITLPASVTSVGSRAFDGCTGLLTADLAVSLISIGEYAFHGCTNLTNIALPSSLTSLGNRAFEGCTGLLSVDFPANLASIGDSAFNGCTSLEGITIPASVTSLGGGAFNHCTSLVNIDVDPMNPSYSSLDGVLFDKVQTVLLQCPGGKTGDYSIPDGVTSISGWAFGGCANLTSITLPASVTSIGAAAFSGCTSLARITIPDGVTTIPHGVFYSCSNLTEVILPASVVSIGDVVFSECANLGGVYFAGDAPSLGLRVFSRQVIVYHLPDSANWGDRFGGRRVALWLPRMKPEHSRFGLPDSPFSFKISWANDKVVVVETSGSLDSPDWVPVSTNIVVDGTSLFADPEWADHPSRYYRLRAQ